MASLFSTTSQIAAINTRARSGVITLPLTTASLYRQIMIKDLYGAFPLSTLTLSTQLGDAFEDGTTSRILSNAYEFQALYAGSTSRWHTVGGTQFTAAYISSLRVDSLQLGSGDGWADFGPLRATAISSLLVQTALVQANAMSTFAISTGTLTAGNISVATLSTTYGFFSTISSGRIFAQFVGDGSGLTGLPAGGLSIIPPVLSTTTLSTNLLTASNISTNSISTNNLTVSNLYGNGITVLLGLSVNTISTNQVNSGSISNSGVISTTGINVGSLSSINISTLNLAAGSISTLTLGAATAYITNLFVGTEDFGSALTASSNITQTGGTTVLAGLSVNTISTNQVNSSNICNAGWFSNNGVLSNITAGAFFQATSNTTTLGVAQTATFASNITQTGGTTVLTGLSVNTISTNQINSGSISNSGLISTTGINVGSLSSINISTLNLAAGNISTLTLGAATAYVTNLFVGTEDFGSALTASSNITQTAGTTTLAGLSVNTISTNQINSSNICNAGWFSNNGVLSNITAGAFFQATSNTTTLGVAQTATFASNITQTGGTTVLAGLSVNTISTNQVNSGSISNSGVISTTGINVGSLSSINISTLNLAAGNISTLTLGAATAYITNLFVGTEDFGSALTASSNITQTGGTTTLTGLSVNTISTSFVITRNISATTMSTNYGFFSTISSGSLYGRFIGDGSGLTGLPAAGAGVTSTLSTLVFLTSSISSSYITSQQGYISSLTVDFLAIGSNFGYVNMGDIIATSLSSIAIETQTLTTSNLKVGTVSSLSYIAFPGLQQGYAQSVMAEQSTGTGLQELLVFRGSSASDRIRMQTTGSIIFEPGVSARVYPAVPSNVTPAMIITTGSNVGIGIAAPGVSLDVAGAGRFTAVSTNTISTTSILANTLSLSGNLNMNCNDITNIRTMTFNTAAGTAQINGVYPNQLNIQAANVYILGNLNFYGTGYNFDLATNNIINANITRTTVLSTNTISTNQLNSSNICNAGFISNNGILSNTTAGAFFQNTSNTGTLGVAGVATLAAATVTALSNSGNFSNAGFISNNGILSNTTAAAFFQNTSNTGTLGVAGAATFASNITQTAGGAYISNAGNFSNGGSATFFSNGTSVASHSTTNAYPFATFKINTAGTNTATPVTPLLLMVGSYGGSIAGGLTQGVGPVLTLGTIPDGGATQEGYRLTGSNSAFYGNVNMQGNNISNVGEYLRFSTGSYMYSAKQGSFTSAFLDIVGTGGDGQLRLINGTSEIALRANSDLGIIPTSGYSIVLNGPITANYNLNMNNSNISNVNFIRTTAVSTNTISTNTILANNISTNSLAAYEGFFSTFGTELGFSQEAYFSTIFTENLIGQHAFMSSIIVNSIQIGETTGFITMGDVLTNSVSTNTISSGTVYGTFIGNGSGITGISGGGSIPAFLSTNNISTGIITTSNICVGTISTNSYVSYPGLAQQYTQSILAEQETGTGLQEMLIFRGSSASDRIRLQTTGYIVFETGVGARVYPTITSNVTPSWMIDVNGCVGVGIIPSGTASKLDVAGQGRFQNLSTTSIQAGSMNLSVAFV